MQKLLCLLAFSLWSTPFFAQLDLNADEFINIGLEGFPASMLPKGADAVVFLASHNSEGLVAAVESDGEFTLLDDFREETGFFNLAKMYGEPEWVDGEATMMSQMPFRATTVTYYFTFSNGHFSLRDEVIEDPNSELLDAMEAALERGDICSAIEHLNGVQYPFSYVDTDDFFSQALIMSHEKGLALYREKRYQEAIEQLECTLLDSWGTYPEEYTEDHAGGEILYGLSKEQYESILGDHGLFLLRAKAYKRCIEVNENLLQLNPSLVGPRLQLGDAYWANGEPDKAEEVYRAYKSMMMEAGKASKIPSRVQQRIGNG